MSASVETKQPKKKKIKSPLSFSWNQVLSDANGQTSAPSVIGVFAALICMLILSASTIFYFFNIAEAANILLIIDKVIQIFGISAGLLGVKSIAMAFGKNQIAMGTPLQNLEANQGQYSMPYGTYSNYNPYATQHYYQQNYNQPQMSQNDIVDDSEEEHIY